MVTLPGLYNDSGHAVLHQFKCFLTFWICMRLNVRAELHVLILQSKLLKLIEREI